MTTTKARLIVYGIWGGAFAISMFTVQFSPSFRRNIISPTDAQSALVKIAALYIPVLTAFGTFWYRDKGPKKVASTLTHQRWVGALSATLFYQSFLLLRVVYITCLEPYGSVDGQPVATYLELMSHVVEIGLLLSPLATLPVAYLLGVEELPVK